MKRFRILLKFFVKNSIFCAVSCNLMLGFNFKVIFLTVTYKCFLACLTAVDEGDVIFVIFCCLNVKFQY